MRLTGKMDVEVKKMGDGFQYEFSWDGFDESDHVSGRGWAAPLDVGIIEGEICFHFGDHSKFWARRVKIH